MFIQGQIAQFVGRRLPVGSWLLLFFCFFSFALAQRTTLTVLTHDSWAMDKTLLTQFEQQSGIKLKFLKGGDAGAMLNKAILSKSAPIADVIYGFDNTLLSLALDSGILKPYRSPLLKGLRPELLLDQTYRATPVDFGYVALNYDREYLKDKALPQGFSELATPDFAKLLVLENPATSSPGLAFLLATVAAFGEDQYLNFWEDLRKNGARVVNGWNDAYYTHFTRAKGDRPLVVSYATSPAAELFYSEAKPKPTEPPTANLFLNKSSFLQVEFAGVLKGSKNQKAARMFIDWLISKAAQEAIPTQMWVYPALQNARLPEVFRFAQVPSDPAKLAPALIAKNRTRWIAEWTRVVLQGQSADAVKAKR